MDIISSPADKSSETLVLQYSLVYPAAMLCTSHHRYAVCPYSLTAPAYAYLLKSTCEAWFCIIKASSWWRLTPGAHESRFSAF